MCNFDDPNMQKFYLKFERMKKELSDHILQEDSNTRLLDSIARNLETMAIEMRQQKEQTKGIIEAWDSLQGGLSLIYILSKISKALLTIGAFCGAIWIGLKAGSWIK